MKISPRRIVLLLAWNFLCITLGVGAFLCFGKTGFFWTILACLVLPFVITPNPPNEDGAREDRTILPAIGVVLLALLTPSFADSPVIAAVFGLIPGVLAGRLILILTRCP